MTSNVPPQWLTRDYWQGRFIENDTPWELGHPSSALLEAFEYLEGQGVSVDGKRVLSPGCGRGSDAIALAERGARVVAVDWSPVAVEDIQARYRRLSHIRGNVEVEAGDFFTLKPRPVDIVAEHTFFCAIDPTARERYVKRIAEWLVPGGYLVGNFFVLSEEEALALRGLSLTQSGEGPPFATTAEKLRALMEDRFDEVLLRPALNSEPDRRPGMEWIGIFRRR
jgi:cyclopropane fatty-acyl-phospholipid synthase-like methyltransferase